MKIEHIAINVRDPRAMARWYERHLGMTILRDLGTGCFMSDEANEVVLEIYHNPKAPVPDYGSMDPLTFHVAFESKDVPADCRRLVAAGATVVGEIPKKSEEDVLAMLRDPWGLAVQIAGRKKPLKGSRSP